MLEGVSDRHVYPFLVERGTVTPEVDVQPGFGALVCARLATQEFGTDNLCLDFDTAAPGKALEASTKGIVHSVAPLALSAQDGVVT